MERTYSSIMKKINLGTSIWKAYDYIVQVQLLEQRIKVIG